MKYLILSVLVLGACAKKNDTAPTPLHVYGDSISQGFTTNHPTYPELIAASRNMAIDNQSHGGTSIFDQNPAGDSSQYPLLINAKWENNAVIMWAPGTNDAILHGSDAAYLAQYQQGVVDVLNKIHAQHLTAFIGTPFHTCDEVRFVSNAIVDMYADINRQVVANLADPKIKLIDYNQHFTSDSTTTLDCYHPTTAGYRVLANYFLSL